MGVDKALGAAKQTMEECFSREILAALANRLGPLTFVKAEIVDDDDVTRRQHRRKLGVNLDLADATVHRHVDEERDCKTAVAQSGNEGLRLQSARQSAWPWEKSAKLCRPACWSGKDRDPFRSTHNAAENINRWLSSPENPPSSQSSPLEADQHLLAHFLGSNVSRDVTGLRFFQYRVTGVTLPHICSACLI